MIMMPRAIVLGCLTGLLAVGCASAPPPVKTVTPVTPLAGILPTGPSAKAPERPPNHEEGARLFKSGMEQLNQHNDTQALAFFEQSADADPTQAATFNNLGILYRRAQQPDKAIDAYQTAIARQAAYPEAEYNLGVAYRAAGQFKKAEEAYLKALALNDQFADAHYNLGILYDLYLAQPANALEQYRAYLKLNGANSQDVARWVSVLERVVPGAAPPQNPPQAQPPAPTPANPPAAAPTPSAAPATQHNGETR